MRRLLTCVAVTAVGVVGALSFDGPAAAHPEDCPPVRPWPEVVATAPVVFTGTVSAVVDDGREATVDVIRIWRGAPTPAKVQVRGTVATQAKVQTAHDRSYSVGNTYLFVPSAGSSPTFIEDTCSPTTILNSSLAALQPEGGGALPTGKADATPSDSGLTKLLPLGLAAVACAAIAALLLRARRADRRPAR